MVVAEALATGVRTISTKGASWTGLDKEHGGWCVDYRVDTMAAALALPDADRAAMDARGRVWTARDFGWNGNAARMVDVHAWCFGQDDRPYCVETA